MSHIVLITPDIPALADLELSWATVEYSAEDGSAHCESLHEAGNALVAVGILDGDGATILGSDVMVSPGLLVTAPMCWMSFRGM